MIAAGVLIKKDLRIFYSRPLFYMIAGICALVWSPIYIYEFGEYISQLVGTMGSNGEVIGFHERVISGFVEWVNFVLLLFVNGITMKLITEEKKNRTFDLIMTSPISSRQIVFAKFVSGYLIVLSLLFVSLLFPLTSMFFGKVPLGPLFSAYLGLALFSGVYVGIGLFASSMTNSVLVAFLLSLIFNLFLWFAGIGSEHAANSLMAQFFEFINFEPILKAFISGVVRLSSVIYLMSITFLACVAAERVIETSRWR